MTKTWTIKVESWRNNDGNDNNENDNNNRSNGNNHHKNNNENQNLSSYKNVLFERKKCKYLTQSTKNKNK